MMNYKKWLIGGASILFGLGALSLDLVPTEISKWVVGLGFVIAGLVTLGYMR